MYSHLSVFDLDHTLLKVNSSYQLGAYLYRQKQFKPLSLFSCLFFYACHKRLGLSMFHLHQKIFIHLFQGWNIQELRKQVDAFLDEAFLSMLNCSVFQRLRKAQEEGEYVVLLSSSPNFLVEPIAQRLQVSAWKASSYEADVTGALSHISEVIEGHHKASYVKDLSRLFSICPECITAYSDSYLDLPVLEIAGRAIAVDPDRRLRKICLKKGWEIL